MPLKLKGFLGTLTLKGLFQGLISTGKEGTLIVSDGSSRKIIYFHQGSKKDLSIVSEGKIHQVTSLHQPVVRLLSTGEHKGLFLGELLVKSGHLTEPQLQKALQHQKELALWKEAGDQPKKLGDIIVEQGYLTRDEINRAVRHQISEEIYELFTWSLADSPESTRKIEYEFIGGPPPLDLVGAANPVTELDFDVKSLLEEATRQLDGWPRLKEVITHPGMVFTITELGETLANNSKTDPVTRRILLLVDGIRTIENIVMESGLPRFQIYESIYEFHQKEAIKEVTLEELKTKGHDLVKEGKLGQALLLYQQAVRINSKDIPAQDNLAEILESMNKSQEASESYHKLARLLIEKDKGDLAIMAYQKAIRCQPENINLHRSLLDLLKVRQSVPEALKAGKELLKLYVAKHNLSEATTLIEELMALAPPNFEFFELRAYIAKVYYELGEFKKSRQEMDRAIAELPSKRVKDLIKAYKSILAIEPKHADARYQLDMLLLGQARKRRRRLKFIGLVTAALVLIGLITWLIKTEYNNYQQFKRLQTELQSLKAKGQYALVLEKYKSFKADLPFYTWINVQREIKRCQAQIKEIEQQTQLADIEEETRLQNLYLTAQETEEKADLLSKPLALYQTVMVESEKKHFTQLAGKAKAKVETINQYLKAARTCYKKADELDNAGRIEEARHMILQLINSYPKSEIAQTAKIPVKIESIPSGAEASINNHSLGKTPLKAYLAPKEDSSLVIQYPGFLTHEQIVKGYGQSLIKVILEKYPLWVYETNGVIEATPVVYQNTLYIGSRDGNLYALSALTGELLWRFATDSASEIVTIPVPDPAHGRLFVLSADNDLYTLGLATGSKMKKTKIETAVKASATLAPDGQMVFLGSTDQVIYCLAPDSGKVIWKFRTAGKILAPSTLVGETLYTPSNDGTLYAFRCTPEQGNLLWNVKIGGELVTQPLVLNNICYLGSSDTNCYAVNLTDRTIKWSYKTSGNISGLVSLGKNTIVVTSDHGFCYALDSDSGILRWEIQFNGQIKAAPVVSSEGTIYLGTTEGFLYALSPTGKELWHYKTGGKIIASPALNEQLVFVGTADRKIYAIER